MHSLKEADLNGKTVFLRADLDVALVNGEIEDDTRLQSAIPTIEYLLKQNARIIIAGHLGRPSPKSQISPVPKGGNLKSQIGTNKNDFSLRPAARWFADKLKIENCKFKVRDLSGFEGWEIGPDIFLLENLRFYKEEEKNDPEFSKKLASLADIYVNEAFANSHRNHASIAGVPKYLPHFAGFHLQQEIEVLSKVLKNPDRPFIVIIAGAKLETKLPLVEAMHRIADYVLVGGKLAEDIKTLFKIQHEKIEGRKSALLIADLKPKGRRYYRKEHRKFFTDC